MAESNTGAAPRPKAGKGKKKIWQNIAFGKAHLHCSFNNTIVTFTDDRGNVICWATAGGSGFKGTKKGTPFAAQVTAGKAARRALEIGMKQVAIFVRGPGVGRETAVRAIQGAGLQIVTIKDVSPLPLL